MLRTLGLKARLMALAAPVAVVTVVGVLVGLLTKAPVATLLLVGAVGAVGVVATVILAGLIAATITRSLGELSDAADEVAASLPVVLERAQGGEDVEYDEIPVASDDEIGRLTTSVNVMSKTSVEFAKAQASVAQETTDVRTQIANMFVNVARRDQTLLKRLLSQLDQLERSEENPDTLDALFKLDHLATRMRRNAESLLVLAGRESSRRRRQPMPVTDVVRSASSEIEHYERVDLAQYVDPGMLGHSALPTAHMLAELLENATRYSDPGSRVSVETNEGPAGIRITISDTGLGMSADELKKFNDRIANPPTEDVIAAEKMGFYVVGRLAKKLEATVTLAKAEPKGTVATVDLSPALFVPGSVKPVLADGESAADGDATWHSEPVADHVEPAQADEAPVKMTVTPDLSAAADAFAALDAEEMINPEIVAAPSKPGALPGRGLPARGGKADALPARGAKAEAPVEDAPVLPTRGAKAEPVEAPAEEPAPAADDADTAPSPQFGAAPSPQFGAPPVMDEPARVPAPRTDAAGPDASRGSGLFGGLNRREPVAPSGEPAEAPAEAPAVRSLSSRVGAEGPSATSQLSALGRAVPAAPVEAPAPVAAPLAPVARVTPTGAGAMDIVPNSGKSRGRRKQERGASPMPSVDAIAAAAAAQDEAYVPQAFVPSGPIGGAPAEAPAAGESSLSDVLRARSAMASQALSELSQLSGSAPLVRRERGATDVGKFVASTPTPNEAPATPARPTRSAADVRSMLSGFQAGVNRGRDREDAPNAADGK